ncbi:hypothetical protein HYC85_030929 [Camellia sinensis]|uniref:Uncharacterized protein n=1 Tax=Camellia sinensis TaxID=4442 RepID=A0A7J7FSP3_CAMSI|nr:hypothetical protein HYC85_030929 [Camellia sinensis]
MYLCSYSVRFPIRTNLSVPKQFSRLLKRTHFDFLHNSSIPLLYLPLKIEISCGSSSFRIYQSNNASSTTRPMLCSLRSEHTMASQSQKPQSVHELTVKVS